MDRQTNRQTDKLTNGQTDKQTNMTDYPIVAEGAYNKWYHCDDKHVTETNLLTLSNNVYLIGVCLVVCVFLNLVTCVFFI